MEMKKAYLDWCREIYSNLEGEPGV